MAPKEYRDYWKNICVGWTEDQVRQLLGGPDEIKPMVTVMGEMASMWKYGQWPFHGTISFVAGKVVAMKLPAFNTIRW